MDVCHRFLCQKICCPAIDGQDIDLPSGEVKILIPVNSICIRIINVQQLDSADSC